MPGEPPRGVRPPARRPAAAPGPTVGAPKRGDAPKRVRVVLADVTGPPHTVRPTREELAEGTGIGEALVKGLVRTQLALAVRCAAVVAVGLGSLPLLFAVAPVVAGERPFGVVLPWLLLGVAAYPFLFAVGWAYVHLAERTERDFTDLVERS